MRILVLRAAAQPLVPGVVRIPPMDRHGAEAAFRVRDGLIQRHDDRVGFRAFADGDDRLRHGQPRLRQADRLGAWDAATAWHRRRVRQPPSSLAWAMIRRAIKRGSTPA